MSWRDYQERAAQLFRDLDCLAEVEVTIQGVRAKHEIDVWVEFKRFGIVNRWVIECKDWKSSIPKEKVLTLKGVIEDIGADRGILIAESGFQQGAIDTAYSTNITLTTLANLITQAKEDFYRVILEKLEKKTNYLQYRERNLYITEQTGPNSWTSSPRPGVDGKKCMYVGGQLSILDTGFKSVRIKKFPAPISFDDSGNEVIIATNIDEFVEKVGKILEETERWIVKQEAIANQAKNKRS